MKSFKSFIKEDEHSLKKEKEDWSPVLTGKELHDRLKERKSMRVFNALKNHPWHKDQISYGTAMGGQNLYKHRQDEYGHHEIKSASTAKPKDHHHYYISPHGKVYNIHHYRVNDERSKEHSEKSGQKVVAYDHVKSLHDVKED